MKEEKTYTASPNLGKFFEKISNLKKEVMEKFEETKNPDILQIYYRLEAIYKEKVDA